MSMNFFVVPTTLKEVNPEDYYTYVHIGQRFYLGWTFRSYEYGNRAGQPVFMKIKNSWQWESFLRKLPTDFKIVDEADRIYTSYEMLHIIDGCPKVDPEPLKEDKFSRHFYYYDLNGYLFCTENFS